MKRKSLVCFLLLALLLLLVACGADKPECSPHTDNDGDKKCDECGAEVLSDETVSECTTHTDANNDKKCDSCGVDMPADDPTEDPNDDPMDDPTDDPTADEPTADNPTADDPTDVPTECITHNDVDLDHICDLCESEISTHSDVNMDRKCDYCEESFIVECSSHIDVDGNHKCDYCRALKTEKCIDPIDANADQKCDICGEYYNSKSIFLIINDEIQPFGDLMEFYQGLVFQEGGSFFTSEDEPGYETHALFPIVNVLELLGIESVEDEESVVAKKGDKTVTIYKSLPIEMYEGEKEKQNRLSLAQVEERAIGKTVDGVFLVSDEPISYIAKYFGFKFHFNAAFDLRVVDCFIECPDDADHKCELCELHPAVECESHLDSDGDFKCDECERVCAEKIRLFVAGNEISEGQYIQFYNEDVILDSSKPIKREEVTKIMVPMIAILRAIGAEITENTETYVEFSHRANSYRLEKGERLALIDLSTNENDMRGDGSYVSVDTDVLVDSEALQQTMLYNFGEYWEVFVLYNVKTIEFRCYIVWA